MRRMANRLVVALALSAVAAASFVILDGNAADGGEKFQPRQSESRRSSAEREQVARLQTAAQRLESLHVIKGRPQAGDWLASHEEPGQSFDDYRASRPNRPTNRRRTIYLQPLGTFNAKQQSVLEITARFVSLFYDLPVKRLEPIDLKRIPAEAQRVHPEWGDEQLLTTYVLYDLLIPRRPDDAVALLALSTKDLWPGEDWNFVFGQADLRQRVGVWSLYRYGDPTAGEEEYTLYLRRTLKVAVHETGHMLGILHCTAYECGMNGSNHRAELDRNQLVFCPQCAAKVWWATGTDPVKRYQKLAEFATKHKLTEDARRWQAAYRRLVDE